MIFVLLVISHVDITKPATSQAADLGLISAAELNQNLSGWRVLDARLEADFLAGHIPGAASFPWEEHTQIDKNGVPYRIMPPEKMAAALGRLGITRQSAVAVYGDADKSWGAEGWICWMLVWLGHEGPIRLMDGGMDVWAGNRYPVEKGNTEPAIRVVEYQYAVRTAVNISAADIQKKAGMIQLVDVRSTFEWIMGRIPGATHIPWEKFYKGDERRPLSPSETVALLKEKGIDPQKPIVYYCAGGIRSGYAWMVHELAGLPEAVNFEGGMEEWARQNNLK